MDSVQTRAACIGLGGLGAIEARALADIDGVSMVAGADVDPDARAAFETEFDVPTYADYERLLATHPDLDFVSIATPHALHYEQVGACLDAGLDVHVEKPMVTDADHARELIARAEAADCTLAVGYQRHFDPRFRELRRLVDEGRIGDPHMVVCHLEQVWISGNADAWRGDPDLSGGGQLFDSGSHLLDALCWTTRADPVAVSAEIDDRGHDVDVNSALAVRLDRDGTRLTASVGVSGAGQSTPSPGERFEILGTEGSVAFDGETIAVSEAGTTYGATPPEPGFEELTRAKLENAVAASRGEAFLEAAPEDALAVTALTEAAYESAERGERVRVDTG